MESLKNKIEYKMTNFNRVEIIKQDNLKNRVETRIQTRIEKNKKNKILKRSQKNKKIFEIRITSVKFKKIISIQAFCEYGLKSEKK